MVEKKSEHPLGKFHKTFKGKIGQIFFFFFKNWSNALPKLLTCIRFLYKVVNKIGRLRKFNRAREIEFNFFIAWTISLKLGTLVYHVHGYKILPQIF